MSPIYSQADDVISPELSPQEHLLWNGSPRGGIQFKAQDIALIPFSLLWCGFAIFWEYMAVSQIPKSAGPPSIIFPLWGIPFVLAGLYFVFGRFIADAIARAKTAYAVTDQRVIILSGVFSRRVKSLDLRTLAQIELSERADGSGTITFGPINPLAGGFRGWPGASQYTSPAFEMIDQARQVYEIIRAAQNPT